MIKNGEERHALFVKDRLEDGTTRFFAPIKHEPLKTFLHTTTMVKTKGSKGKVTELQLERDILGKLVALSNKHNSPVDLDKALSYCLGSVPLSLANPDGTMRTTAKSKLLMIIAEFCPVIDTQDLP